MSLDPVTALLDVGSKVIDRLWPDPIDANKAKLELYKLQQDGELQVIAGQLQINAVEAAHPSLFVSGWRPFIGWVCGFALVYQFLAFPMLEWVSASFNVAAPLPLELGTLITVLGGMLGLGTLRTTERIKKVARK